MLKAFFRDSAVYGIAKLLTGGMTLLSLPIYTHALPPGEYGAVDLLTSIATVAHVTVALEIAQGMARLMMAPEGEGKRERYTSTALFFTFATYTVFTLAMMPLGGVVSQLLFGHTDYANVVRVATMVIWSTGQFNLVQNLLRYARRAPRYAMVSVLFAATNMGVTILLLLVLKAGLVALFIGQFVAGCAALALGLWFARDTVRFVFDWKLCREMLAFSIPLVPSGVGLMLCMYVDRFAVLKLLSVNDLGLYAVAFRVSTVVAIVVAGFDAALAPLVFQKHHLPETPAQLARTLRWFLALAAPLMLFLALFAEDLVRIVAPASYGGASRLVVFLSTSMLIANLYNFSPGLWIAKRTGWVAIISLGAGVLNLVLNFVLIPRVGLIGAALGTFIAAIATCTAHVVLGGAHYKVPFDWRRLGAGVGFAIGATFAASHLGLPLVVRGVAWIAISLASSAILLGKSDIVPIHARVVGFLETRRAQR